MVVLDADKHDCAEFLKELVALATKCGVGSKTLFRLAIEEIEAWYFGDRAAVLSAYSDAKQPVLDGYEQDSICNTWEALADAIHPGGLSAIKRAGWPLQGQIKHDWANRIGARMDPEINGSPSFRKFRDGLRRLSAKER